ncbi:MAG TPA: hypothetical protein VF624_12975 [Tepidisphaeraceae bacterium]|jgi:hypothetical protein
MAKKPAKEIRPAPPVRKPPRAPINWAPYRKVALHGIAAVAFSAVVGVGFKASKDYVEQHIRPAGPPRVTIRNRPAWMNDTLAARITGSVRAYVAAPASDTSLLQADAQTLSVDPWVKRVRGVRRVYDQQPGDTIEIDAEFRAPVALVRERDNYWYVDAEGVRLPEKLSAEQAGQLIDAGRSMRFRIIEGAAEPPIAAGLPWPGGDVQAGIEMIALLADKPYADQIVKIDVSNFNGRVNPNESQLNLITRYGTEVRWGQPPSATAFFVEQRVNRKLEYLQQARQQTGRVDMNLQWIDLRFDNPTVPDARGRARTN